MTRLRWDELRKRLAGETSAELLRFLRIASSSGEMCAVDRLNLRLLEADLAETDVQKPEASHESTRIAIVSLLFNWPSTGGGIVHTAELAKFLSLSGYAVCHFYAEHEPWGVGVVQEPLAYPANAIKFAAGEFEPEKIKSRFREEVRKFTPDCVIITDSWNAKPLLAEAVCEFNYCLRLAAMECLCPFNNVRLLFGDDGLPRQCQFNQLASRKTCLQCVKERASSSGGLHLAERELAQFYDSNYGERLRSAFSNAQAILAVNNQIAALVEPYARDVRVIPSGFDASRFNELPQRAAGERPYRILFAGLVQEIMKGFHILHEACRRLWSMRQDFELWVTSEPFETQDPFLRFCGWQSQSQLPATMAGCDIVVVPTIAQEALGRTAVEAMGASRAVIASRLGGLKETVCDGLTGLLVNPADAADLARAISKLIDSPDLIAQFGANGRRRFEEFFPWEIIIDHHYRPLFAESRALK